MGEKKKSGVGGGGGKIAKAFLDLGFTKTLLVNTTEKDQPSGVDPQHFVLVPGADGVGKDIALGKKVISENSAFVEDAVRTRIGQVDWLFVVAGGGGPRRCVAPAQDAFRPRRPHQRRPPLRGAGGPMDRYVYLETGTDPQGGVHS